MSGVVCPPWPCQSLAGALPSFLASVCGPGSSVTRLFIVAIASFTDSLIPGVTLKPNCVDSPGESVTKSQFEYVTMYS